MEKYLTIILCLTVLVLVSDGNALDPCVDYETLDQTLFGSRNEICPRPYNPYNRLCDYRLAPNWYLIPHNGVLKNTCPVTGSCGTEFPVWLNGTLPLVSDGIVNMTCCIKVLEDCCYDNINIQVKNCSNRIVYYLPSLEYCDSVYCIETDLPCDKTTTTTIATTTAPVVTTESVSVLTTPGESDDKSETDLPCEQTTTTTTAAAATTTTTPVVTTESVSVFTTPGESDDKSDTSTKPAFTSMYFPTRQENIIHDSDDKISMLISVCIILGVLLCIVTGVAVYFIYVSKRCKKQPMKIGTFDSYITVSSIDGFKPSTPPPPYSP